jgi:O-antigen/teichoic acid export membrane protein
LARNERLMSRFKRFAHSLASGYVLLGANMFYTLASIPLALHYLSKAEFGLWALTVTIMGYVLLVDLGMSGSIARILIDYKGHHTKLEYGSVIQTGALVGAVQGVLIFVAGAATSFVLAPVFKVPATLEHEFVWLLVGQSALLGASFALRIFSHLLVAHQRYDVTNYTGSVLFVVNYIVLWFFFAHGGGIFSILWSQAIGIAVSNAMNIWGCVRLKLLPHRGEWGRASWARFTELFKFGRDVFLFALGSQLIYASQIALLTRLLGLEVATVWSVCTRTYIVILQVISKIFDYSSPALAEMMVHGEKELLRRRFREIVTVAMSLSVVAAAGFAICNGPFVRVWLSDKIIWSTLNDGLLAVWLVATVCVRLHTGLVGQTKVLGFLRYLYLFEGLAFVSLTLLLRDWRGMTTMLLLSIGCCCCFSLPYGLRRTRQYFGLHWRDLADWHRGPLRLALWLMPAAIAIWVLTRQLPDFWRLILNATSIGLLAFWVFLRHGLGEYLQGRLLQSSPNWVKALLVRIGLPSPSAESR